LDSEQQEFLLAQRSTKATSAIFEASVTAMKHRFAKNAPPMATAVKSAGEFIFTPGPATECA